VEKPKPPPIPGCSPHSTPKGLRSELRFRLPKYNCGLGCQPNHMAKQTIHDILEYFREDPKYILNLLKSIITVSVETMTVVNGLPALKEKKGP
jgi:hypothetical protein